MMKRVSSVLILFFLIVACENGNSPDLSDIDRDGIPDEREQAVASYLGMPLYDWGARVEQTDVFLHIFYMRDLDNPGLIPPTRYALEKTRDTFENYGVALHIDAGDFFSDEISPENFNLSGKNHEIEFMKTFPLVQGVASGIGSELFTLASSTREIIREMDDPIRQEIFLFAFFVNSESDDEDDERVGMANNIPGQFCAIYKSTISSLLPLRRLRGISVTPEELEIAIMNEEASTLVHELGHLFGLRHGGFEDQDFKPNYPSVMNYGYNAGVQPVGVTQSPFFFEGRDNTIFIIFQEAFPFSSSVYGEGFVFNNPLREDYQILFSDGSRPDLNERRLFELEGLGGGLPVDFNVNGRFETEPIRQNLDSSSDLRILRDHDDRELLASSPFSKTRPNSLSIAGGSRSQRARFYSKSPVRGGFHNKDDSK